MTHSHTPAPAGEKRHVAVSDALRDKYPRQDEIERIILHRLHNNRIAGYTLEMAHEIAALAAEPGEAVAECTKFNAVGRKCVGGECDWHRAYIVMESILRESQDRCRKLQAKLDTHPAPSGQTVAVKPLEWEEGNPFPWYAADLYRIEDNGTNWKEDRYWLFIVGERSKHPTLEAAKAAAQADYEKRVLSALAHPHLLPLKEEVERVLEALLRRDEINTCRHEETHRGGFLWEICDQCGAKWADDQGGKPEWSDPAEWVAARSLLSRIRAGAQEGWKPIAECADEGNEDQPDETAAASRPLPSEERR